MLPLGQYIAHTVMLAWIQTDESNAEADKEYR